MKEINLKDFFADLRFDKSVYKYVCDAGVLQQSVSAITSRYYNDVDFDAIAVYLDKKNKLPEGTTKKIWDLKKNESIARGNRLHFYMSLYPFYRHLEPSTDMEKAIKNFFDSLPSYIVPVLTEYTMYHKQCMYVGTVDLIMQNTKNGKYIIADIKTNDALFKNYRGNTLKHPFDFMLDNNYSKYIIQLSLYKMLLEQVDGVEVDELWLVWVKQDGTYQIYKVPDVTQILKKDLQC